MCPFRPEEHGTERPLQNHNVLLVAGFVEAARFLGGQKVSPSMAKRRHSPGNAFFVLRAEEAYDAHEREIQIRNPQPGAKRDIRCMIGIIRES
jgi:hypothetical protein